jgi:2'-5' RNA ligase
MRRHSLPLRPEGPQRALVWFPSLADAGAVATYRARHDPRAELIAPHVTFVFPFRCSLTTLQIQTHAKRVVRCWPQLPVTFQGVDPYLDQYLFLRVRYGGAAVMELHQQLYRGILAPFLRDDIPYVPHLTVGRTTSREDLRLAMADAWMLDHPLSDTLRELTLVETTTLGRATPLATIPLDQP